VIIILSMSCPLFAEFLGIAQIGRSYFPALVGILLLLGYAAGKFLGKEELPWQELRKKPVVLALGVALALNAVVNFFIFFSDVYPGRMGVTFMSRTIKKLGIKSIATYLHHPYRINFVDSLSPEVVRGVRFIRMDNISQPSSGYILVPPVTGNAIYNPAHGSFNDFDQDIFLNELLRKGNIADYAVASFKTLATSPIWSEEEEILAYKNLVLNHPREDINRTKVWLLDAGKLKKDFQKNLPSVEYILLERQGIRNIGTRLAVYRYEGKEIFLTQGRDFSSFPFRIFKVGDPEDGLRLYVYRVSPEEPLWIPFNDHFASNVVAAREITADPSGGLVNFSFSVPLSFGPGRYRFVIYRTGKPDDNNFYRIYQ
jgi:hypothetical protein